MIWSIIPEDMIFSQADLSTDALIQQDYLGRQVLVRQTESGRKEIVHILSTNPADFLDNRFSPGSLIDI